MSKLASFQSMMDRIRLGNPEAAAELVRRFEPIIHRAVRRPLLYFSLHREFDPHDISQMVLARFFLQKWAWRRQLTHPEQLVELLLQMTRNRIRNELRKLRVRRGGRRLQPAEADGRLRAMLSWVLERQP